MIFFLLNGIIIVVNKMNEFGEVLENVSLKDFNTYKIGGKARYVIKPFNIQRLIELLKYLEKNCLRYFILGKGSNVILPDEDYEGAIINLEKLNNIAIKENEIYVEAGITLNKFIKYCVDNSYSGFENLYGIYGTLGGAIIQNAGCHASEISDNIISVTYIENGKIYTIKKEDCNFKYRCCETFKNNKNKIILGATFKKIIGNKLEMEEVIKKNISKRLLTQPLEYPNAGSVFKNPEYCAAGKLIDDNNLKGYHINDAYVSNKHANFIINKGNATSKDIQDLINYIKKIILEKEHIELELEQEIIKY